ncbi:uncharacterized protein LOC123562500 [Mercenaria mercenaria]|uniref:uncharacterized protein LOC123562500 n=1 Tax=Mercenaria mercenaria TaxID=6596 RepID=UPI00234F6EFE|nr:uncharacterized protein LOC123562500 [Mercenaria mercenaria]
MFAHVNCQESAKHLTIATLSTVVVKTTTNTGTVILANVAVASLAPTPETASRVPALMIAPGLSTNVQTTTNTGTAQTITVTVEAVTEAFTAKIIKMRLHEKLRESLRYAILLKINSTEIDTSVVVVLVIVVKRKPHSKNASSLEHKPQQCKP